MVTPCMPTCPPVTCDVLDYTGQSRQVKSYGRKKRSSSSALAIRTKRQADPEEVLVVQTLRIVDKSKVLPSQSLLPPSQNFTLPTSRVQETSMLPTHPEKCVEEKAGTSCQRDHYSTWKHNGFAVLHVRKWIHSSTPLEFSFSCLNLSLEQKQKFQSALFKK